MSKENKDAKEVKQEETLFPKKWAKILESMPEFKSTADSSSVDELKKIIVTSEGNIYNVQNELLNDDKLNAAKALVKDFMGPYQDAKKVQMCKIQYALFRLSEKGTELGDKE